MQGGGRLFRHKRVLVTGACGTVGRELVRQLLETPQQALEEVVCLDNDESGLFFLERHHEDDPRIQCYVADIRDRDELVRRMHGIDIVFHVAALKHVMLSEKSPEQVVQTNIVGLQNVISAASQQRVEKVIFTSSDKAVNPTNVMGTSKLMGERLMTAANTHNGSEGPIFSSTRFGNVLGSNGSVMQVFQSQIAVGGPVTLTHPEMTRFVMSIPQAVALVIDSAGMARGGEVFITKMPVMRIIDLARAMIDELAPRFGFSPNSIEIKHTGVKPGEKLYEELMTGEETRRAVEVKKYFVVLPAFRSLYQKIDYNYPDLTSSKVEKSYVSSDEMPLSLQEVRSFLEEHSLLRVLGDGPIPGLEAAGRSR